MERTQYERRCRLRGKKSQWGAHQEQQPWGSWVPAVSLTGALCWRGLHVVCMGSSGQGPSSLSLLITFPPSPLLTVSEESSLFIFGECRGRVERSPALTQDVSPKYFNLAQTSKLVFSLFSLSHPSLEAEAACRRVEEESGRGWGVGAAGRAPERKSLGHYPQNVSCCVVVVGLEASTHLGAPELTCKQCSK